MELCSNEIDGDAWRPTPPPPLHRFPWRSARSVTTPRLLTRPSARGRRASRTHVCFARVRSERARPPRARASSRAVLLLRVRVGARGVGRVARPCRVCGGSVGGAGGACASRSRTRRASRSSSCRRKVCSSSARARCDHEAESKRRTGAKEGNGRERKGMEGNGRERKVATTAAAGSSPSPPNRRPSPVVVLGRVSPGRGDDTTARVTVGRRRRRVYIDMVADVRAAAVSVACYRFAWPHCGPRSRARCALFLSVALSLSLSLARSALSLWWW